MSEHIHRGEGKTLASSRASSPGVPLEGWSQLANQSLQRVIKTGSGKPLQGLLGLGGNADEKQVFASSDMPPTDCVFVARGKDSHFTVDKPGDHS